MSSDTPTCDWQGQSGRIYRYWIHPLPPNFAPAAGNYIFAKRNSQGYWQAVYIGQTKDLSERFDDHHRARCISTNGATHIHVHTSGNETERRSEESDLIARYAASCNIAA